MRQPALILVVDDNEANRDILARRLEVNGYALAFAADGEEALERARSLLPDLDPARRHDAKTRRPGSVPPT